MISKLVRNQYLYQRLELLLLLRLNNGGNNTRVKKLVNSLGDGPAAAVKEGQNGIALILLKRMGLWVE